MHKKTFSFSLVVGLMLGGVSYADTAYLSGGVVMELQNEYTKNTNDPDADDRNDLFFRIEVAPTVQVSDSFFIDGVVVLERTQDREPGQSNWFDNEGIFVEEIKVNYEDGDWTFFAGKFNPQFGSAWDFGRGIWGEDFAEDYEITERLGFGASYNFDADKIGVHTLSASSFFADTSILSGSAITNRGRVDESDGGVSNTEDFSSYVVSLEGSEIGGLDGLSYQLAYRDQAAGDFDKQAERERGYAAMLGYGFDVTDRISSDALLEYVDIQNFDSGSNDNRYVSASIVSVFDNTWSVSVGYTARDIDVSAENDIHDYLLQLSAGYDFGQGTTAEIGWRNADENGVDSDIIGGLIRHSFSF